LPDIWTGGNDGGKELLLNLRPNFDSAKKMLCYISALVAAPGLRHHSD